MKTCELIDLACDRVEKDIEEIKAMGAWFAPSEAECREIWSAGLGKIRGLPNRRPVPPWIMIVDSVAVGGMFPEGVWEWVCGDSAFASDPDHIRAACRDLAKSWAKQRRVTMNGYTTESASASVMVARSSLAFEELHIGSWHKVYAYYHTNLPEDEDAPCGPDFDVFEDIGVADKFLDYNFSNPPF